jgi:hypothetical protein
MSSVILIPIKYEKQHTFTLIYFRDENKEIYKLEVLRGNSMMYDTKIDIDQLKKLTGYWMDFGPNDVEKNSLVLALTIEGKYMHIDGKRKDGNDKDNLFFGILQDGSYLIITNEIVQFKIEANDVIEGMQQIIGSEKNDYILYGKNNIYIVANHVYISNNDSNSFETMNQLIDYYHNNKLDSRFKECESVKLA